MSKTKKVKPEAKVKMVRFDKVAYQDVSTRARALGVSDEELIRCAVAHVLSFEEDEHKLLIKKELPGPFEEISNCVNRLAWADHAFRVAMNVESSLFTSWPLQEYQRLVGAAKREPALKQFCDYRRAYLWARQSRLLRRTAFQLVSHGGVIIDEGLEAWNVLYNAADESLRIAISYNELLCEISPHRVLNYNIGCYWSMKLLFLLESYLPVSGTVAWRKKLLTALVKDPDGKARIERFMKDWHSQFNATKGSMFHALSGTVVDWLSRSYSALEKSAESQDELDTSFLMDYAEEDADLFPLMFHPSFKLRYDDLKEKCFSRLGDDFKHLDKNLPKEFSKLGISQKLSIFKHLADAAPQEIKDKLHNDHQVPERPRIRIEDFVPAT